MNGDLTPTTPTDRAELQRVARQLPDAIEGVDRPYSFGHEVRRVLFDFDALEQRIAELKRALKGTSLWMLRDGTRCWCRTGDRGPNGEHAENCDAARAALAGEGS